MISADDLSGLTLEQLRAKMVGTGVGWTNQQWLDWESLPRDQQVEGLRDQMLLCQGRPVDILADVEAIALAMAKIMGVASGIASGVGFVQELKGAL